MITTGGFRDSGAGASFEGGEVASVCEACEDWSVEQNHSPAGQPSEAADSWAKAKFGKLDTAAKTTGANKNGRMNDSSLRNGSGYTVALDDTRRKEEFCFFGKGNAW